MSEDAGMQCFSRAEPTCLASGNGRSSGGKRLSSSSPPQTSSSSSFDEAVAEAELDDADFEGFDELELVFEEDEDFDLLVDLEFELDEESVDEDLLLLDEEFMVEDDLLLLDEESVDEDLLLLDEVLDDEDLLESDLSFVDDDDEASLDDLLE